VPKRKKLKIVERKLGRERAWGLCYQGENLIELDPRMSSKKHLVVALHEGLHHIFLDDLSESKVEKFSVILANIIWGQGYRRIRE
jgi:hypothetical protein